MFEALSEKLNGVFSRFTSKGRLTEKDVEDGLREVRLALLEADVNFKVARDFIQRVRERAVGSDVMESLSPGQQIVKIVHEEMTRILGGESSRLDISPQPPTVVMLAGLQGSGKTTTAAKLALNLKRSGQRVLMVAGDLRRPAAIEQLETLGRQLEVPVYSEGTDSNAVKVCREGVQKGKDLGVGWVILDTGGRLHIDDEMMSELGEVVKATSPTEVLLVVDAMTGQDAVQSAEGFHGGIGLTGLIVTKLDGDARGGAALSISEVTGLPIKYMATGERPDALEAFHPDRLASRILGMGDVLTLVERAQENIDRQRAQELERKIRKATFNLEDFLEQIHQVNKMGPISQVMEMIPGLSSLTQEDAHGRPGREAHEEDGGHCLLNDPERAAQPGHSERQPQAAHSQGQRLHAPGGQPGSQPVPPDPEADEADVLRQAAPQPDGNVPLGAGSTLSCAAAYPAGSDGSSWSVAGWPRWW